MRKEIHLNISIRDNHDIIIEPLKEPLYMPYLSELIKYLALLGYTQDNRVYTDKHMERFDPLYPVRLDDRITRHIYMENDTYYILGRWQYDYCLDNKGFIKSHFVRLQLIVYELLELWSLGLFNFKITDYQCNEYVPEINVPIRKKRETKEIIRRLKRMVPEKVTRKIDACDKRKLRPYPGNIFACCVCRPWDIKLVKKYEA